MRFRIAEIMYETKKTARERTGIEKIGLNERLFIPSMIIMISMTNACTRKMPKLYFEVFNTTFLYLTREKILVSSYLAKTNIEILSNKTLSEKLL